MFRTVGFSLIGTCYFFCELFTKLRTHFSLLPCLGGLWLCKFWPPNVLWCMPLPPSSARTLCCQFRRVGPGHIQGSCHLQKSSPNSFFVVTTFLLVDKASERTSSYRWKNQSTAINHAHPTDDVERDTGNPQKRKIPEVRGDFRIKISCWLLLLLIRFGGLELWFRVLGHIFNLQTTYQNLTWTIKTPRQKWGYGKKSRNFHESYITQWYFSHLPSVTRCPNL